MMKIAFLGQGAMGSRMAARLMAAGHEVTAWNRTPSTGTVATAEAAVFGADLVISSLRDDAASVAVRTRVLPLMASGAAVKLMVNALFGTQLAAMAELLGLARATGIDPARAVEILTATPVASPALAGAAAAMLAGKFAPAFPISLVVKDFGLALESVSDLPVTRAVAEVYRDAERKGLGDENITAVVQRYVRR